MARSVDQGNARGARCTAATAGGMRRAMAGERCTHYLCRCARAAELAEMSDRATDPGVARRLLAAAIAVHTQDVRCRAVYVARGRQTIEWSQPNDPTEW